MNDSHTNQYDDIKKGILEKIRNGEVRMHSRAYFAGKVALLALLAILVVATSAFLASFIYFDFSVTHRMSLLNFGGRGIEAFFAVFPWTILAIDIVLVALFALLLRRWSFAYRRPIAYLLLGVLAAVAGVGALLSRTPIHVVMLDQEMHGGVPVVGMIYDRVQRSSPEHGVFRAVVTLVGTSTFSVEHLDGDDDWDDGNCIVITEGEDPIEKTLRPGDLVIVAGDYTEGQIRAYGVEKIGREAEWVPR